MYTVTNTCVEYTLRPERLCLTIGRKDYAHFISTDTSLPIHQTEPKQPKSGSPQLLTLDSFHITGQ